MLVAEREDTLVLAHNATRGETYRCPECGLPVNLRRGRVYVPHFAHQQSATCAHGEGESIAHRQMKMSLFEMFQSVSLEVTAVPGRRADAVVTSEEGKRFVVEFQASSISLEEWEARTWQYSRAGIPVWWVWHVDLLHRVSRYGDERRLSEPMLRCAEESGGVLWVWRDNRIYCVGLVPSEERASAQWGATRPATIRGILPELWFPHHIGRGFPDDGRIRYAARRGAKNQDLAFVTFEDYPQYRQFDGLTAEWNMWHERWNRCLQRSQDRGTASSLHLLAERPPPELNYPFRTILLVSQSVCPHDPSGWCEECYGPDDLPWNQTSPAREAGMRWEDHHFSDPITYGRHISEF